MLPWVGQQLEVDLIEQWLAAQTAAAEAALESVQTFPGIELLIRPRDV